MATPPSVESLLRDIMEWAARIDRYVEGLDFESFAADTLTQDAVIRCLEVIGEASARILNHHPEFQARFPDLPLRQAYRARNRTAHGYGSVNIETVWRSATLAAPQLAARIREILDERG
jgi:uncharacterized protein with HEPN domain